MNEHDITDKCVTCNCDTPALKTTHVDARSNYIEGVGQLCDKCYNSIIFIEKNEYGK